MEIVACAAVAAYWRAARLINISTDISVIVTLISLLHSTVDLTLGVPLGRGLSFIVHFFTLAQTNFDLDSAALEVYRKGNKGVAILLHLAVQAHDLPLVHEQSAGALGIGIEAVAVLVGGDVHLVNEQLAVLDTAPGIFQIQGALANRLDLRAAQLDTGLIFFFYKILMPGLPVGGHDFDAFLFQIAHLLFLLNGYYTIIVKRNKRMVKQ